MQRTAHRPSATHLQVLGRASERESGSSPRTTSPQPMLGSPETTAREQPFELEIRLARFTDLPAINAIERVYPLWQPQLSVRGYNPASTLLNSRLRRGSEKTTMVVALSGGQIIAFADFKPSMPDHRWQLQAVGASTGVYDPGPIWEELFTSAIRQAGLNGVKRLYARSTPGTNTTVALRGAGFAPYAVETVFVADSPRTIGAEVAMREQEPDDTWAIHQLYNASVPKNVLYAEALTSHAWDIERTRFPGSPKTTGWLADDVSNIAAYVRVTSDRGIHGVEITFAPGAVKRASALLDALLRRLRLEKRISRVYIALRSYQQEMESTLARLGFAPVLTQELFVRYTAVPIRAVTVEGTVQHVELGDRVPSQAPSILTVTPHGGGNE